MSQYDRITSETAAHVLYAFDAEGGHPAGGFVTTLLDAFSKADPTNEARLALGFPGYAQAYDLARRGHYDLLRDIAQNGPIR